MNLQQARAKPHRSFFRQFTEAAAYALLFAVPAANAHSPQEAAASAEPDGVDIGNVALHTIRRQKVDEVETRQEIGEPLITNFTPHPDGWDALPETVITGKLRAIEKRVNATNPKYPVTIMDDDSINLRRTENVQTFRNRMYEVLNDRNISLRWNMKSDIATALGGLKGPGQRDPQAFRVDPDSYQESRNPLDENVDQKHGCVVITSVPDLSSRSFINKWVGHKAGPNIMEAKVDPGPYAMTLRTTWHEAWHCIDPHFLAEGYYIKGDPAIDNAVRMHKAEVFAEVAAVLTLAPEFPHIAQQMADIRAISSDYESRKTLPGMRPSDASYYDGVVYYLTRALDLVEEHIRTVGMDAVSRYSMDDISRIARDITLRGALSKAELHQMAASLLSGAPTSARVKLAKERLLQDTGIPLPPKPTRSQRTAIDDDHYFVDRILQDIPEAEKEHIQETVGEMARAAIARGQLGEHGLIALIEDWRKHVQEETPEARAYERKLYVLSLMLTQGSLESALGRESRRARAEKAARAMAEAAAKREAEARDTAAVTTPPPEDHMDAAVVAPVATPLPQSAPLQEIQLMKLPAWGAVATVDISQGGATAEPIQVLPKMPSFTP